MSNSVYRRCGCRDESGKQLGKNCPKIKSDPKHGTWEYRLSHGSDPKTGQRRQFRTGGFATKRAAESALADQKVKLDKGTYIKPSEVTLGEYAPKWLGPIARPPETASERPQWPVMTTTSGTTSIPLPWAA